ncbi:MAG: T9SS type A sorting domain-containing protein [Flavipsychrobacter sp.]
MILQLTQAALLSCFLLLFTASSFAQTTTTYTAIANGNYTSASTWQSGIVPPVTTGLVSYSEHIVIPQGITVTLDTNLHLKTSGWYPRMTVDGSLIGLPGYYAKIQAPLISSATGVVNIDSTFLQGINAGVDFQGTMTTNNCYMSNYTFKGTLNINKRLHMHNASDVNQVYGTLNFGNHCWIQSEGRCRFHTVTYNNGTSIVSGVINYADTMNLSYKYLWLGGINPFLDIDTNYIGRQIDSLIIDLDTNYSSPQVPWALRVVHKDVYFNGVMIIKSGNLNLNHKNIIFGPNSKLYCTPNKGRIKTEKDADITINATSDFGDGFIFWDETILTTPADTVRNFTVNMGNNTGTVKLHNNLIINNKLDLQKGQLHLADTSKLIINHNTNATITNASTNSYVTSSFGGALHMNVAASGTTTFPVGTPAQYAPVDVKNNSSSSEVYKVGAVAGVKDTVVTGFDIATQEPCVAATWWVNPSAATGSSANVTIKWPAALEVNSFNRTQSYITTYLYSQLKWDTQTTASAAGSQGSLYTQTQTVNNFDTGKSNFFSVFDGATSLANLSVNNLTTNNKVILYPNPTQGNATLSITLEKTQPIAITLTDVNGRVVHAQPITEYNNGQHNIALPTQNLTNGLYFLQLTNEKGTLLNSGKLMKQ